MRKRKRKLSEIDSDDLNSDSTTNTTSTHSLLQSMPSAKRQRIKTCNTNSRRKIKATNSNSDNINEQKATKPKIKNQKPIKPSFESCKINKFEIKNYCNQKINILFGTKLISIQWLLLTENNRTKNKFLKLYNNAKSVRINIKFDNIQCIKYESNKWEKILKLKLKKPPYFTEQACAKFRESQQKTAHFYTINTDPTDGFAQKYKNYEISLKTNSDFLTKIKNGSKILKKLIKENEKKNIDWNDNETFDQNELEQVTKNKKKNKKINKYLSKDEVDKILMSLGVKKEDLQCVNDCLRVAISKKYVGITHGRFRLDKNKGINQKMKKLSKILNGGCDYDENDECKCYKEITLKSLIGQPNNGGGDYENGNMEGAARCKCMEVDDGWYCDEALMYVTELCINKPKLTDGQFHNHCNEDSCNKCMGDHKNYHCYKCGVHGAWLGKCHHCDDESNESDDNESDDESDYVFTI